MVYGSSKGVLLDLSHQLFLEDWSSGEEAEDLEIQELESLLALGQRLKCGSLLNLGCFIILVPNT